MQRILDAELQDTHLEVTDLEQKVVFNRQRKKSIAKKVTKGEPRPSSGSSSSHEVSVHAKASIDAVVHKEMKEEEYDVYESLVTGKVYDAQTGMELDTEQVEKARQLDMRRLQELCVYKWIPKNQKMKTVRCRWVDVQKEPGMARSRIVAMDIAWDARMDTFAGTPAIKIIRILFSLAASKPDTRKRKLGRYDMSVAFFHSDIDEEMAAIPPAPIDTSLEKWELLKALYGTHRASFLRTEYLAGKLILEGFTSCKTSGNLFYHAVHDMTAVYHGEDHMC